MVYESFFHLSAMLSITLLACRRQTIAGMRFALLSATYKIGFPGWPEPNLDSVTGFGASIEKKGACTSPLFYFPRPVPGQTSSGGWPKVPASRPGSWNQGFFVTQKSERPLGGAAARAWGMEGTVTLSQLGLLAVLLRSRAAGRHTGADR
jgi:hypothetical protein